MNRRAFSLIELLLAVALSVVLMAAVLAAFGGLARDARRITLAPPIDNVQKITQMLSWDLTNSRTMIAAPDGSAVVLVGHSGIGRDTATPNGRLVRITYRCIHERGDSWLVREQQFLDDPARPMRWRELVAGGVATLNLTPVGQQAIEPDPRAQLDENLDLPLAVRAGTIMSIPPRVRLRMNGPSFALDRQLVVK
jgi:prepilin-type N-terminal cleavage/methylation domain-containing protein